LFNQKYSGISPQGTAEARERATRLSSTIKQQTGKLPRIKRRGRREECSPQADVGGAHAFE
jgi:hypothetical protein